MKLRDYQSEAIEKSLTEYKAGNHQQLICMPTGTGKTATFSGLIAAALSIVKSAIVIVPRIELLYQTAKQFRAFFPEIPCCIYHNKHKEFSTVTFSTFQTLNARYNEIDNQNIGLCIFDEAHHAIAPSCEKILKQLGFMRDKFLVGFTATSKRSDGIGLQRIFKKIVFSKSISEMVGLGWLCPIQGIKVKTGISLNPALKKKKGLEVKGQYVLNEDEERQKNKNPFNKGMLDKLLNCKDRNERVVQTYLEHCKDRKKGIVFCETLHHAEDLCKEFLDNGVSAGYIHCYMSRKERDKVIKKFKNGDYKILCNMRLLTEGFDEPSVDLVMLAKPTSSQLVYTQMVGRGTRICEGKEDCMVVDFDDQCDIPLMDIQSLSDKPKGPNPFADLPDFDNTEEIEPKECIFFSDGILHIQKIDFDALKRNYEKSNKWRSTPCTEKQRRLYKLVNKMTRFKNEQIIIEGRRLIDLNKGELSDLINASPATNLQKQLIKDFGVDTEESLTFGSATEIIDKHKPAKEESVTKLKEIYENHLKKQVPEKLTQKEAMLLIENAPLSEEQKVFLDQAGINTATLNFLSAQKLINQIRCSHRVSM